MRDRINTSDYIKFCSNMSAMDAFVSCLWTLYDEYCDDTNIVQAIFDKYVLERSRVIENELNDCGHTIDDDLARWLYSLDIEGIEDVSRFEYKNLEDC